MDGKKKVYTKADFDAYAEAVKRELEQVLLRQRERIDELRTQLDAAEKKVADNESKKELVYKAITAALKKADDIERVTLIKYNQEIAQLKSFHNKWVGYFNRIMAQYPLDDELAAASKVNGRIAEVLGKTGDLDEQYRAERERLMQSVADDDDFDVSEASAAAAESAAQFAQSATDDEYKDRSPSGFSIAEALHPKDDLMDIMRELGVIMDDE